MELSTQMKRLISIYEMADGTFDVIHFDPTAPRGQGLSNPIQAGSGLQVSEYIEEVLVKESLRVRQPRRVQEADSPAANPRSPFGA